MGRIKAITSVTLLLLALLPEVILFSAIVNSLERTRVTLAKKTVESMVWAVLFLLPTIALFAMTLYTLVNLALVDHVVHQEPWAIVTRCVSAWAYALIGIVYASWKHGVQTDQGEQEQNGATNNTPVQSDAEKMLQKFAEMNQQNLITLQEANRVAMQDIMQHLSGVTVQLVEETVNRTIATVALSPAQIEAPQEALNADVGVCSGEQHKRYASLIEALYQQRSDITVTEIVDELGCSRSTASKWLQRVKTV